ncbi:MAG: PilZ domain-containing protein [Leptospirillia bacterium]
MENESEQRAFGRASVEMAVVLTSSSGGTVAGPCRDLSLDGLFVCCDPRLESGDVCTIWMTHSANGHDLRIKARGVVARITPGGLGLLFTDVGAAELRQIYNLLLESDVTA